MKYEKHVFVCINKREEGKVCCAARGSEEVVKILKEKVATKGLAGKIRINKSGCLGQCSQGISAVVYPEGIWYGGFTLNHIDDFIESHLIHNKPLEKIRTDLKK